MPKTKDIASRTRLPFEVKRMSNGFFSTKNNNNLSIQQLLARDHISSASFNVPLQSSALSNYTESEKKKLRAFSNGLNLTAYQKRMILPRDIFKE